MKRAIFVIFGLLIIIAGYFLCAPYIAVYNIKSSIKENNPEKLSNHVDFHTLRQSFKDQINLHIIKSGVEKLKDNPFSALSSTLASKFTESLVDSIITPYGVMHLINKYPNPNNKKNSEDLEGEEKGKRKDFLADAAYKHHSLNKFSISLNNNETNKKVVFYLKRYGLIYKLASIELPAEDLLKKINTNTAGNDRPGKLKSDYLESNNDMGNLKISTLGIDSRFVENTKSGRLFVITGKIRNDYDSNRSLVQVKANILAVGKKIVDTETVFCGNMLDESDLTMMDIEEIKKKLRFSAGDNNANLNIAPGRLVPFMVVFSNLPKDLEEFTIEVVRSTDG